MIPIGFSTDLKRSLSDARPEDCCAFSELSALIMTAGSLGISGAGIRCEIRSENPAVFSAADDILGRYFGTRTVGEVLERQFGRTVITRYISPEAVAAVFRECGIFAADESGAPMLSEKVPPYLFACPGCAAAYVRGAFLGSGHASVPEGFDSGKSSSGYALEWTFARETMADAFCEVLTGLGAPPKKKKKKEKFVVYIRNSETICDLLARIGAENAVLFIEAERASRSMRNSMQRGTNCISYNLSKLAKSAAETLSAVSALAKSGRLSGLDQRTREIADLRLDNPEASLSELLEKCSFKISKSGLKYKLDRLARM